MMGANTDFLFGAMLAAVVVGLGWLLYSTFREAPEPQSEEPAAPKNISVMLPPTLVENFVPPVTGAVYTVPSSVITNTEPSESLTVRAPRKKKSPSVKARRGRPVKKNTTKKVAKTPARKTRRG